MYWGYNASARVQTNTREKRVHTTECEGRKVIKDDVDCWQIARKRERERDLFNCRGSFGGEKYRSAAAAAMSTANVQQRDCAHKKKVFFLPMIHQLIEYLLALVHPCTALLLLLLLLR